MAKIRIDWGDLEMAFDSGDGTDNWYLDRQTGDVIWLSDDSGIEELEEIRERIEADEEENRFIPIPSLSSHEGFRIMEDFAARQEDARVRDALFDALDRRRPFRSFKDALTAFPEVRERWFEYHEERLREEALSWLRSEEIDAELVPLAGDKGEETEAV